MSEYKGYYPDDPDGQIVPVDTGEIHSPIAYELQQRATQIFGEVPLSPMAADDEDPEDALIRQGDAWFDALPEEEKARLRAQDAATLATFQEPGVAEATYSVFSRDPSEYPQIIAESQME